MGHRALLARERPDGRYDVYYAHWGGADLSLARRLAGNWAPDEPPDPASDPAVRNAPRSVGVAFEAVLADHLDPLVHELLVVLGRDAVDAYRPLWFGPVAGEADTPSALVSVDPRVARDDERVLAWFRGTRDAVADLLARGAIDGPTASTCLRRRLRAWGRDREVIHVPGTGD
jgi:hypothetical protein